MLEPVANGTLGDSWFSLTIVSQRTGPGGKAEYLLKNGIPALLDDKPEIIAEVQRSHLGAYRVVRADVVHSSQVLLQDIASGLIETSCISGAAAAELARTSPDFMESNRERHRRQKGKKGKGKGKKGKGGKRR